jgi:hypothetical protein
VPKQVNAGNSSRFGSNDGKDMEVWILGNKFDVAAKNQPSLARGKLEFFQRA